MRYRNLGKSGLKVSEIGLGCNNFGWRIDDATSNQIVQKAIELGINHFDTANTYGETRSEEYLGKALVGKRSQVIIATKFGSPLSKGVNDSGGSRYHIMRSVEDSLRRLKTDYIDLYQMHRFDPTTPIEETLRALDDLVRSGKVRYIGCSNYAGWQLADSLWTSKVNNLHSFVTIQSEYSLLYRSIEPEVVPCCKAHNVGVIPWGPLAAGFLTGKYRRNVPAAAGTRLAEVNDLKSILSNSNFDLLDKLEAFAKVRGHEVQELALAWMLAHPWVSTVIAGASKPEQLDSHISALDWKLNDVEMAELNSITAACITESIAKYRGAR